MEEVIAFNVSKEEEVIDVAASIEILSNHPIAESIVKASKIFSLDKSPPVAYTIINNYVKC